MMMKGWFRGMGSVAGYGDGDECCWQREVGALDGHATINAPDLTGSLARAIEMGCRMAWHHGGWRGERRRPGFVTAAAEMGRAVGGC
ncbi:hypothetical protein V6N11_001315 [Hibiscus sabdariffa]|uniref:Uncharacterized protein n=1 Tax=Hibiscus sabdariffa TaxID=183260 RepID=A0ABR2S039_9ROSI